MGRTIEIEIEVGEGRRCEEEEGEARCARLSGFGDALLLL